MPVYVSLVKFIELVISTMKQQGIARSEAVQRNIETLGGKLLDAYYGLGAYDVVAILEFPNNRAAMKAAVLNATISQNRILEMEGMSGLYFFFSSRRRHTRFDCDWSSDVCSSD